MSNVGEIILSTLIILVFFLLIFLEILRKTSWLFIKKTPPTRTGRAPHEKKWTLTLREKPMLANTNLTKGQLKGIPDNTTNW